MVWSKLLPMNVIIWFFHSWKDRFNTIFFFGWWNSSNGSSIRSLPIFPIVTLAIQKANDKQSIGSNWLMNHLTSWSEISPSVIMVLGFRLLKFCRHFQNYPSSIFLAYFTAMYLFVSILFQSKWQSLKWNLSSWRVDKKELTFLFSKTNKQWSVKNKNITHVNQFYCMHHGLGFQIIEFEQTF